MASADHKGFSMVEIVVAMQIVTVLALLAAPNVYKTMQIYTLRAAARELYSNLQNARMGAVMENHPYRFLLVDGQTYQLHDDVNGNGTIDAGESVTTLSIASDAPGVALSATGAVTFMPNGTALTSVTFTASNGTLTVNVKVGAGGRVRVIYPAS